MKKIAFTSILSIMLLGGCAFSNDELFPVNPAGTDMSADDINNDMPNLGSNSFNPVKVSAGSNTGTFVGKKVSTFRNKLSKLQKSIRDNNNALQKTRATIVSNAAQYHKNVAAMEAKLQIGTTPGNPHMLSALQSAQENVQEMNSNAIILNQISNRVSSDAAETEYLLESIRSTYSISGAVDEDHRQLRVLENETSQTAVVIKSLLGEINADAVRQQKYADSASAHLLNLDGAIRQGSFSGAPSNSYLAPAVIAPNSYNSGINAAPVLPVSGKPLFTAKFNKANVNYSEGLKSAVNSAVAKKPNVNFDIVAVDPANSNQTARDKAAKIFQEINAMGVSADRISIAGKNSVDTKSPEVQIFVR